MSRLLRQDRFRVRGAHAQLASGPRGRVGVPPVEAVVRGRADVRYVPAVDDEAAVQSDADRRAAPARSASCRRQLHLL